MTFTGTGIATHLAASESASLAAPRREFPIVATSRGNAKSAAADSVAAAFFTGLIDWDRTDTVQLVFRDQLERNPFNPRIWVTREAMFDLQQGIERVGIHTPLDICRNATNDHGILLSGHRRLWVVDSLHLDLVPVKLDPRGVLSKVQMLEAVLRYNEGQERPAPIDEAVAILGYMESGKLDRKEAAKRLGLSESSIFCSLKLLTLPEALRERVNQGKIDKSIGYQLTRLPRDSSEQLSLAKRVEAEGLTVEAVTRAIKEMRGGARLIGAIRDSTRSKRRPDPEQRKRATLTLGTVEKPVHISISGRADRKFDSPTVAKALRRALLSVPVEMDEHHGNASSAASTVVGATSDVTKSALTNGHPHGSAAQAAGSPLQAALVAEETQIKQISTPRGSMATSVADSLRAVFLDGYPDWTKTNLVQLIYVDALSPHPLNPRKVVDRQKFEDLVSGIRKVGIHDALNISKHPESERRAYLMAGHRRLFAARTLKLGLVPCTLDPREVLSETDARERLLQDNMGRIPPGVIDRAVSYREFLELSGFDRDKACLRLQVDRPRLDRALELLKLPDDVQQWVNEELLNEKVAHALLTCTTGPGNIKRFARQAIERRFSARQVKEQIQRFGFSAAAVDSAASEDLGTERHWIDHETDRLHIRLIAPGQDLSPRQLAEVIEESISRIERMAGSGESLNFVQIEATAEEFGGDALAKVQAPAARVSLSSLFSSHVTGVSVLFTKYAPSLISGEGDLAETDEKTARALQKQLSQENLNSFSFAVSPETVKNCLRWLKVGDRTPPTVSMVELLPYMAAQLKYLRGSPPAKKFLRVDDIDRNPVDTIVASELPTQRQYELVLGKAKSIEHVIKQCLIPIVELESRSKATAAVQQVEVTEKDLAEKFKIPVDVEFKAFYDRWLRSVMTAQSSGQGSYDLQMVKRFLVWCSAQLLALNGGKFAATIGHEQLARARIYTPYRFTNGQKSTSGRNLQIALSNAITAINDAIGQ